LHDQFLGIARAEGLKIESGESRPGAIQHCILAGFPDQVAMRLDKGTLRCALVHNRHGLLARESSVHDADLIVASEIREIESGDKERQVLLTLATKIEEEWLRELFPKAFRDETIVAFDSVQRRVAGRRETRFYDLTLHSATTGEVPAESAAAILAREVFEGHLVLKNWDNTVEQWIARVHFVAGWFPELELPRIGESEKLSLLEQICLGAFSYREIKERPVWPVVKSWLSPAQQRALDELAPERIKLAGGKSVKITYSESNPPTIAARIQDLYGVKKNLIVGRGKIALRIQVLAPNHRPIQIADDLENFWSATYPKIKKELQRKYPKHEWR
jgi:ATP-dependent helicase HrpB